MLIKLTATQAEDMLNSLLSALGLAGTQVQIKDFNAGENPSALWGELAENTIIAKS